MKPNSLVANLKKSFQIFLAKIRPVALYGQKPFKLLLNYFQTSETIFLLFFATLIGVGSGFGAIIFRWIITFFQNLFFTQGQHTLAFLGLVCLLP